MPHWHVAECLASLQLILLLLELLAPFFSLTFLTIPFLLLFFLHAQVGNMVELLLDGLLLLEHHSPILLKLVIELGLLALKFHKLLELKLLVGIDLDLMLVYECIKLGLNLLGYLRLVRFLLERVGFFRNTGLLSFVELLDVALQVGVRVVKSRGLLPHLMLQPRQVLIGLLARQPIHLVDVVDVSLVDLPSLELQLTQISLVLLRLLLVPLTTVVTFLAGAALDGAAPRLALCAVFPVALQPALVGAAARAISVVVAAAQLAHLLLIIVLEEHLGRVQGVPQVASIPFVGHVGELARIVCQIQHVLERHRFCLRERGILNQSRFFIDLRLRLVDFFFFLHLLQF